MTRVDRTDQLLDAVRQQILEKLGSRGATSGTTPASGSTTGRRVESSAELRQRLSRELQTSDLSDPAGRRRARISFLEAVLIWDFGDAVLRDPHFGTLIQHVEETIGRDSRASEQFDEFLAALAERHPI